MDTANYQGWTNHATWAVNLHLGNDQDLYNQAVEIMAQPVEIDEWTGNDEPEDWAEICTHRAQQDRLKDFVESITIGEDGTELQAAAESAGLASLLIGDLLRGYLDDVNWRELAEAWRQNLAEQVNHAELLEKAKLAHYKATHAAALPDPDDY